MYIFITLFLVFSVKFYLKRVYLNHRSVNPFIFYSIADDVNVGDPTSLIKREEISQSCGATETVSSPTDNI